MNPGSASSASGAPCRVEYIDYFALAIIFRQCGTFDFAYG